MSTSRDGANPQELGASALRAPAVRFDAVWLPGDETPLRGVSFALAPGSFHILTGGPGSGKTSLLRLICLAEAPAQGLVQIFGRDVWTLDRKAQAALRRRIGAAPQPATFLDHLSVWENAALAPRIAGRKLKDYRSEVDQVLAWLGLAKQANGRPSVLGPAGQQSLALARAVVGRPELLLVDELDGGLEPAAMTRLLKVLGELHQAGATVLLASRDAGLPARARRPELRLQDGRASLPELAGA